MSYRLNPMRQVIHATQIVIMGFTQLMRAVRMRLRSHTALAAEVLFLRRQVDLYEERTPKWQCNLNVTRCTKVVTTPRADVSRCGSARFKGRSPLCDTGLLPVGLPTA